MAGWSLQDLANALGNSISKQALNKYELGLMNPTSQTLLELSKVLKLKPDFFIRQNQVEFGEIQFRKRVSLSKKDEESIVERAKDYVERCLEIENILNISNEFLNPLHKFNIEKREDVELAANFLRASWELGNDPIPNLADTLELRGIKVFLIEEADDIDGFAVITNSNIPLVVVNCKERSLERIRFTIIHELAHLLLRLDELKLEHKEIEIYCHFFASCFLLPSKMLVSQIGSGQRTYIDIKELILVKEYYGISIRAIVLRLRDMGIITPNYYQRWVIYMSKTYGSKKEPGKYQGNESAKSLFQNVYRALSEGLISLSKASAISGIDINELRRDDSKF